MTPSPLAHADAIGDPLGSDAVRLDAARRMFYERPASALSVAAACHESARAAGDAALSARARALQTAISLHRGDVHGALELVIEAERHAAETDDPVAHAEVAAVRSQVSFFAGSSVEALQHAERAVAHADAAGDLRTRICVRRATCLVVGNLEVDDLEQRVRELLALTLEAGDAWEEAISRNDLACFLLSRDLMAAREEIDRALSRARSLREDNRFAQGVVLSTRADINLQAGRPLEALGDAERAIELLTADPWPNPYVLAVTVRAEVQARMALGRLHDARQRGEEALEWLGERVPQIRSLILSTLAEELRGAGLLEEAYDALARSAELERQAFRELSALRLRLERTSLEAARLREEVERDWLTGLRNRRYLARALRAPDEEGIATPLAVAALDLDRFKQINDTFGHAVGDEVLVRVARLLCDTLREHDVVVRNGGEEFLLLMPAAGRHAAAAACERARAAIAAEPWERVADRLVVTASLGLAVAEHPLDLPRVLQLADERLYSAKRTGRDRVVADGAAGA
ncbi:MAG TPA: diguanylate cyclase [Solirubrobacteraceae bacterium]|nr:diguanylate cyclase [Solirubrobacteraceae bacterium]